MTTMTVSNSKLQRPAVSGEYGLGVDNISEPTRLIAFRSEGGNSPYLEVASADYSSIEDRVRWLVDTVGFPEGRARALEVQLSEKVLAASFRTGL